MWDLVSPAVGLAIFAVDTFLHARIVGWSILAGLCCGLFPAVLGWAGLNGVFRQWQPPWRSVGEPAAISGLLGGWGFATVVAGGLASWGLLKLEARVEELLGPHPSASLHVTGTAIVALGAGVVALLVKPSTRYGSAGLRRWMIQRVFGPRVGPLTIGEPNAGAHALAYRSTFEDDFTYPGAHVEGWGYKAAITRLRLIRQYSG